MALAVLIAVLAAVAAGPSTKSRAAGTCTDPDGYLFQYSSGPTQVDQIDMVTGQQQANIAEIFGREVNAVGYNPLDNKFYGWDNQNNEFVSITDDFLTTTPLTISGYTGPTNLIIGDVDDQGHYWELSGNTWYEIDVSTGTPTQLATGTPASNPTGSAGADWAFVPGTGKLWRTMDSGSDVGLWSFDTTAHTWTHVANVTNMTAGGDRTIGANYADPYNHLFAGSNGTGDLWEIDLTGLPDNPASPVDINAVLVGTGNPSGTNDGARCSLAPIPTDFGDAPDSYHTSLANNGPRHNVENYNTATHTAPLMLGNTVDIEPDGYPGTTAKGDDTHEIDDEDGVKSDSITIGGKTPTSAVIPVTVTNNSSNTATLAGWIDSNNNGIFDSGERATLTVPANSGTKQYTLTFPAAHYTADTYLRIRVFDGSLSDPQPTGPWTGGEVEDYFIHVDPALSGTFIGGVSVGAPDTGFGADRHNIAQTLVVYGLSSVILGGMAFGIRRLARR